MEKYIKKTKEDLRREFKRSFGIEWGAVINPSNRSSAVWYNDEYVEWMEELLAGYMDTAELSKHLALSEKGGKA